MAKTRPYYLVFRGVEHIIETSTAAVAVQHVVGADISELRPARAAEVTAWMRANKSIPLADAKIVVPGADVATSDAQSNDAAAKSVNDKALDFFADWAGYNREEAVTVESGTAMGLFTKMHPAGQMDLMTFDLLRQQAPEFGYAIVAAELNMPRTEDADYVSELEAEYQRGLAQLRARLEDRPMPFAEIVRAVNNHAGQGDAEVA